MSDEAVHQPKILVTAVACGYIDLTTQEVFKMAFEWANQAGLKGKKAKNLEFYQQFDEKDPESPIARMTVLTCETEDTKGTVDGKTN